MSDALQGVAIFDLDYTLTRRGTWGRFTWMCVRARPWTWVPVLLRAGWTQWCYRRGALPRIAVKTAMMRMGMTGTPRAVMQARAERFAEVEVSGRLRKRAIQVIERHRRQGDLLVMATAAVDIIAQPVARKLGFDHVVATPMAWKDGRVGEHFGGANCYSAEKLRRVKSLLTDLNHPSCHITFYSDSASDLPLFEASNVPVAVNADAKLSRIARERDWRVEDWNVYTSDLKTPGDHP